MQEQITDILKIIAAKLDVIADKLDKLPAATDSPSGKTFGEFALYYFERFRWRKVKATTKRPSKDGARSVHVVKHYM